MDRRTFLATSVAVASAAISPTFAQGESKTRWVIRTSEGFDALGFLSPLSGDPFYTREYPDEIAAFGPRLSAATHAELKALRAEVAATDGLLSPNFYLRFSGGPDATVEDIFASMKDPERKLRPALEASPYWDAESWQRFLARLPTLGRILTAMMEAGFRSYRNGLVAPQVISKFPPLRSKLAGVDVIRWAEYYTGRTFDPTIEVIFMHFNKPHGIKITGQRYLTGLAYDDDITIWTAGHEVLHPPITMDGETAKAAMAIFERDKLLQRILAERNKSYGYGSIEGLFNEGLTQTLDQLIGQRLGIKRDPRKRWRESDGGMHVLGAAFYGLMQADGYAERGGNLEQWVATQVSEGNLAPGPLHAAAARVLGYPAGSLWVPNRPRPLVPDITR